MKNSQPKLILAVQCALLAIGAALVTPSSSASAQEVQVSGPLAGAPAVRHMRIYRDSRIQIEPFIGITLQDEYSRTLLAGAQINYHFNDYLAIGAWGGFGIAGLDTGLTGEITDKGQTTSRNRLSLPLRDNFSEQIGRIQWAAALQLTFIPLRGKLALFQKVFLDTDFYIFAGAAFIGLEERENIDLTVSQACRAETVTDPVSACNQLGRATRVAIAPTFGVGLMLYANEFVGISFEWRGMPFAWNTSGTDEAGAGSSGDFPDQLIDAEDQIFHFNHMFKIGVAFYLPTDVGLTE